MFWAREALPRRRRFRYGNINARLWEYRAGRKDSQCDDDLGDSSTLAKSEIVTSQSAVDCAIPDFPKVIMGPVSMKYRGDPAVCAGWEGWGVQDDADYNGDCYIYSPKRNVWTKAAFSISPRANGRLINYAVDCLMGPVKSGQLMPVNRATFSGPNSQNDAYYFG